MLKLRAAAFDDGWAFVESEGQLLLVRPPYRRSVVNQVTEAVLERAVSAHGFQLTNEAFPDWSALIEFLRMRLVEERRANPLIQSSDVRELLRRAPQHVLSKYLDRIEVELLPSREWQAISNILGALLESPALAESPEMRQRAVRLLVRSNQEMASDQSERASLAREADLAARFPNATRKYGPDTITAHTREIADRHQVLVMCA